MRWTDLALATLLALVAGCSSEPALLRQMHKEELIEAIEQALLESVEAEKSAVLSTSDAESAAMAGEAQRLAGDINRLRGELRPLIVSDGRPGEVEALDAFDARWAELESVDHRLLALAVANTNLKAARLSAGEGAAALDRFVDAIDQLQQATSDPTTLRGLSRAAQAALREQSLLLIHIPSAEDAEMTRLEQRMNDLSTQVDGSLAAARATGALSPELLAAAASGWAEHRRIAAEVVRLSRENTNVLSFDVSVHEKRTVTRQCLAALANLEAAVEAGPQPAR